MWIPIENVVNESEFVCEMANKYKEETGLPMNIWIDETQTYVRGGHSKRIKFQLDKSGKLHSNNLGSMDLDGNIRPSKLDIGELSESDINELRNFITNNKYALEMIASQEVKLYKIWPHMIMGGNQASYEEITKLNLKVDELIEMDEL